MPFKKIVPLFIILSILFSARIVRAADNAAYEKVDALIREEKFDEAEEALKKIIAADKNDAVALTALGDIYLRHGDKKKALKYISKAAGQEPVYPPSRFYLGKVYFMMGDFDNAVEEFESFRTIMKSAQPEAEEKAIYVKNLHYISGIYMNIKRYDEAYSAMSEILQMSPADQTAFYNMGIYFYVYKHDRAQAYKNFSKAAAIDANNGIGRHARYAIEFIRANPDSRVEPDFSFLDS